MKGLEREDGCLAANITFLLFCNIWIWILPVVAQRHSISQTSLLGVAVWVPTSHRWGRELIPSPSYLLSPPYAPLLHGRVTVQRSETEDDRTTSSWGLERSWIPVLTSTLPDWTFSLDNYRWEKKSFILVSLWLPKRLSYSSLMGHSCTET